jgi:hypothetical protein
MFNAKLDSQSTMFNAKLDSQSTMFNVKLESQSTMLDSKVSSIQLRLDAFGIGAAVSLAVFAGSANIVSVLEFFDKKSKEKAKRKKTYWQR